MIHAYDRLYLERSRAVLGRMLDFAVHDLIYNIEDFYQMFIDSGIAERFGSGEAAIIAGMSGIELAYEVAEKTEIAVTRVKPQFSQSRSEEYWTGWALAYYQWENSLSFAEINRYIPISDIRDMYNPYHEMDIRHFCDNMNSIYKESKPETNLKLIRTRSGMSQNELAVFSGIPVRTIQQYEQSRKNINNARAEYLIRLSKVLCCEPEDLVEKVTDK